MVRTPRYTPVGFSQHIIQRGNNKQLCFKDQQDFIAYIHWLKEYAQANCVQVHAWVLMDNHVHLLCTPQVDTGISKMMQSLGRQYVRYFNHKYRRTGTLWEGRFKSSLVTNERYLLELYRYIELNPVRANMVNHPSDYKWSSFQINALGKISDLCSPHSLFLLLGETSTERELNYRRFINEAIPKELFNEMKSKTNAGHAFI